MMNIRTMLLQNTFIVILIIIIVIIVAMIYYRDHSRLSGTETEVSGGCPDCGLTTGGKEIIKKSENISEMSQEDVAEYIMKSSLSDDDMTATELKSLHNEIVRVIKEFPGLVDYVVKIKPRSENRNVKDAIEEIQDALSRSSKKTGGSADDYDIRLPDYEYSKDEVEVTGGDFSSVVEETLAVIRPYLREVGSSRSFLSSVSKHLGKSFKFTKKSEKLKLQEGIEALADEHNADSVEDLISKTGMSYEWFVPATKKSVLGLSDAVSDEIDVAGSSKLSDELRDYTRQYSKLRGKPMPARKILNRLLAKAETALRMFKLKRGYSKKSKAVVKKAGEKAFEPDVVGLVPLIDLLSASVFEHSRLYDFFSKSKKLTGEKTSVSDQEKIRDVIREIDSEYEDEKKVERVRKEEEVLRALRWQRLQQLRSDEIARQRQEIEKEKLRIAGLMQEKEKLREELEEEKERKREAEEREREEAARKLEAEQRSREEEEARRRAEEELKRREEREEEARRRAEEEREESEGESGEKSGEESEEENE